MIKGLPAQKLSFSLKGDVWKKKHLDWAEANSYQHNSLVRKSQRNKKINYDLMNGILDMSDLYKTLDPENLQFDSEKIEHYPVMNSKLQVLFGEEKERKFNYSVIVTNPNVITEIEENKKRDILEWLESFIKTKTEQAQQKAQQQQMQQDSVQQTQQQQEPELSPEDEAEIERARKYFTYTWKDMRELRANSLINHYSKEQSFDIIFNEGFKDAIICGEEIYYCNVVSGEPKLERINPQKISIYMSGYSNKVEDADIIVYEDYWSPARIIDTYYDVLSDKDIEKIETNNFGTEYDHDEMKNDIPSNHFRRVDELDQFDIEELFSKHVSSDGPYDLDGNIRVIKMFWKSKRKIKKIIYFDDDGNQDYTYMPEEYQIDQDKGESEEVYWINQAWEGVKIGKDIYVNIRPCPNQFNRINNPSRCHFGFVGTIYNLNEGKPYSFVDIMKRYNYLYDITADRMNKMMARNWGKLVNIDKAHLPKEISIDKMLLYARKNGFILTNSFEEGQFGVATGKMAGSTGRSPVQVIDAEFGTNINQYYQFMQYITEEMGNAVGITRQREAQTGTRETVGGIERSVMQSNYITNWVFTTHEETKKRTIECFLEVCKSALKQNKNGKKFQYIMEDASRRIMEIDGDEFSECDYGLVVENGETSMILNQKLEQLAQAALQTQTLKFSSIIKLYDSCSIAEKKRLIEQEEAEREKQAQQQAQQEQQEMEQQRQQEMQLMQMKMQQEMQIAQLESQTKIKVAEINAQAEANRLALMYDHPEDHTVELAKLEQQKYEFEQNQALKAQELQNKVEEAAQKRELEWAKIFSSKESDLNSIQLQLEKLKNEDKKLSIEREKNNKQFDVEKEKIKSNEKISKHKANNK